MIAGGRGPSSYGVHTVGTNFPSWAGIGFDLDGFRTPQLLHPEGDMAGKTEAAMGYMKGFMDLTSSIDSPGKAS